VRVPGVMVSAQPVTRGAGGPRDQQFANLYDCGD
jgi:hypothetical protein